MKTKKVTLGRLPGAAAFIGTVMLMTSSVSAQNLFVSNFTGQDIYEITPGGTQTIFASGLDYPYGFAFDSMGNLFVANTALDANNEGYITEITPGGVESTFASGLDPKALAFNSGGDLFVADYKSGNIYEYTPGGVQSLFASGFNTPQVLAFNSAGDLFVGGGYGDGNGYITEITLDGTQKAFASGLSFPNAFAFNSTGDLFEADNGSSSVYEFTPGGARSTFASVSSVGGLAFNSAGTLFVSTSSGTIYEYTPGGTQSTFVTESGNPNALAFQPVPEPSVLALAALGGAALIVRRRKS